MTNYVKIVVPPEMADEARKLGISISEASRNGIARAIAAKKKPDRELVSIGVEG